MQIQDGSQNSENQKIFRGINPGSIVPKGPKFAQNCPISNDNQHFPFPAFFKMATLILKIKMFFFRHNFKGL